LRVRARVAATGRAAAAFGIGPAVPFYRRENGNL